MFSAMANRTWVAARVFNQFHAAKAAWDRVKEKLKAIEGSRDVAIPREVNDTHQLSRLRGDVLEVHHLSFAYPGSEKDTISEISFIAHKGEWIGVTGPVGSGKSALAACLTSLYPYRGTFRIDGVEAKTLPADIRAGLIAYSGQDAFLFSTTIRENITFAVEEPDQANRDRLENALKISALWDDLSLFPDGLDTVVGEKGVRVSGGQRQRIALARAIYTNNPILILDDPFSAVDIRTEEKIMDGLMTLTDRIIILITHRVTPFKDAHQILVIRNGQMEEKGVHEELMKDQGTYARIYGAQSWIEEEAAHEG
jgi:ABC-type multidrug transport system fused ATPase/permease subunit